MALSPIPFPYLVFVSLALTRLVSANPPSTAATMVTAPITTKPGCQRKCGNLTVPYPFGIVGNGVECSIHPMYGIYCNTSFNPPKPFFNEGNLEILDISETNIRVRNLVSKTCYKYSKQMPLNKSARFYTAVYSLSHILNQFTVIGCDEIGVLTGVGGQNFSTGCISSCSDIKSVKGTGSSCSGVGCCQSDIPEGYNTFSMQVKSLNNHTNYPANQSCGYAFIGEANRFNFRGSVDITDTELEKRISEEVPLVFDWDVGNGTKCSDAQKNKITYACQGNTICNNSEVASQGYRCLCLPGYEGNPYLTPGCTDIDECAGNGNPCSHICTNTIGSFSCSCPKKHHGDGLNTGKGCLPDYKSQLAFKTALGASSGLLLAFLCISMICFFMRSRRRMKIKETYFEQNGGFLLRQQLSSNHNGMHSTKIFTSNELKSATNNYSRDRILGQGGYGTVYKGFLPNNLIVAIKKSRVSDQSQIKQFINEVVILTGINHRNVVKLLGCCLEEEVPILVYEFISNGTLSELIQNKSSWLTWETSVRIASEASNALSYLHFDVSMPIIHRDVKSSNILIDDTYTSKISDFGISRLIPVDRTRVTTLVQGTFGYLDPEYFHTGRLTEKSDVYSFGVVLAELLTRQKPLFYDKVTEEMNLAAHLMQAINEGTLFEAIHPQLIKEASREDLLSMANVIKRCVNVRGEDRPTMKEVAMELEELKNNIGDQTIK